MTSTPSVDAPAGHRLKFGSNETRRMAGAGLLVLAYFVSGAFSIVSWLEAVAGLSVTQDARQAPAITFLVLSSVLALAGVSIQPVKVLRRVLGVALLVVASLGSYAAQAALRSNFSEMDLDAFVGLSRFSGIVYIALLISAWLVVRQRSLLALAVVVPATALLWFILLLILTALPTEMIPLALILRTGLLVAMAWVGWGIDNRDRLKSGYQPATGPAHAAIAGGAAPVQQRTNGLAIAAFVLSLIIPVVGVILGYVARGQLQREGGQGAGLAQAAIIIGWVFIGLWAIGLILILAAFATF